MPAKKSKPYSSHNALPAAAPSPPTFDAVAVRLQCMRLAADMRASSVANHKFIDNAQTFYKYATEGEMPQQP